MRLLSYDKLKPTKGISYSKCQLWRLEKKGGFPKRVALGANLLSGTAPRGSRSFLLRGGRQNAGFRSTTRAPTRDN
jgi:hypothetical protein